MANEVIITSYKIANPNNSISSGVYGKKVYGEILDIGALSAPIQGNICRVQAKGAGFFFNIGDSLVASTANSDGNIFLADGQVYDFELSKDYNYIKTAAA